MTTRRRVEKARQERFVKSLTEARDTLDGVIEKSERGNTETFDSLEQFSKDMERNISPSRTDGIKRGLGSKHTMKVQIHVDDAIDAHLVPYELQGEHIPDLLRELDDAIVNSPVFGAQEELIQVSVEVARMAYHRLLAYSHNQDARRWSRFKIASDRIYDALKQSGANL